MRLPAFVIAPIVVVRSDVAHLDLPLRFEAGNVCQHAALEELD